MRFIGILITLLLLISSSVPCFAAANIELWPVTQSVVDNKNSSVLWLKNINDSSVSLQVRVLKWQQNDGKNVLTPQTTIYPDPPFLILEPHQQVAVRFFINNASANPSNKESCYRIIINQLPTPDMTQKSSKDADNINIRMEYILPLFIYGSDIPKNILPGINGIPKEKHHVIWGVKNINGTPSLYITNNSLTHIRIIDLQIKNGTTTIFKNTPKNNYILPNSTLVLPLKKGSQLQLQKGDQLIISEPYTKSEDFPFVTH